MTIRIHEQKNLKITAATLVLLLFAFCSSISAQSSLEFISVSAVLGDTTEVDFHSRSPREPNISTNGTLGTASLPRGGGILGVRGDNILTYIPTQLGRDTVTINRGVRSSIGGTTSGLLIIEFINEPSYVDAVEDYSKVTAGQSVTVDVLSNDVTSRANRLVRSIPKMNDCSAVIDAGAQTVTVTPDAGFTGLAYFNYTLCDDIGNCDMATVSIVVEPAVPTNQSLTVYVKERSEQVVLINLENGSIVSGPSNGTVQMGNPVLYTPSIASGTDQVVFNDVVNGVAVTKTVDVIIVDDPNSNTFVNDDYAEVSTQGTILINVLDNDLGGSELRSVSISSSPQNGSLTYVSKGKYLYTPNGTFQGMDQFRYRAANVNSNSYEWGTVQVAVSDQAPQRPVYSFSTEAGVPLVLNYNVPFRDFAFNVVQTGSYGSLTFFPGQIDTMLNGLHIKGDNALIYTPTSGAGTTDILGVDYCITNGVCYGIDFSIEIIANATTADDCAGENCVWPGDANRDGIVNMLDLLPLGICMGEVGHSRPAPTVQDWRGQYGDNWNSIREMAAFDIKNVDMDGNGIVHVDDTLAIRNFYGKTHTFTTAGDESILAGPQVLFLGNIAPVSAGDLVTLELSLGTLANPAVDVHGISFPVQYSTALIQPGSFEVRFDEESWMTYGSPTVQMQIEPITGLVDVGYTRTSRSAATGRDRIGEVSFIVTEDLEGLKTSDNTIRIKIDHLVVMGENGGTRTLQGLEVELPVRTSSDEEVVEMKLFPNPTDGLVTIYVNGGVDKEIQELRLISMQGQTMQHLQQVNQKSVQLSTNDLPNGIYAVAVVTKDGKTVTQKLQVNR